MPSHEIHRLYGSFMGLPEDVLGFIDKLIDNEEKCGVHDIGFEVLPAMSSKQLNTSYSYCQVE